MSHNNNVNSSGEASSAGGARVKVLNVASEYEVALNQPASASPSIAGSSSPSFARASDTSDAHGLEESKKLYLNRIALDKPEPEHEEVKN